MNGPKRLSREEYAVRSSPNNPVMELRFTNEDGKTEVWLIGRDTLSLPEMRPSVRLGFLDEGVDIRLANQVASIERLQRHVKYHDEGLQGMFCPHSGPEPESEDARPAQD